MSHIELLKAIDFAAKKHVNQRRKDARESPYINHPIGVAQILSLAGVTKNEILIAAILHDVVEDTDTSIDEVRMIFGEEVAGIVGEVTDDQSLTKKEMQRAQVVNAAKKSDGAKLVKMADKLYNIRDLSISPPTWDQQRIDNYVRFCKQVVDAIAESDFTDPSTAPIIAALRRDFDAA